MITATDVKNEIRFTKLSASQSFIKLTASEQRSIFFGQYLFGRKSIKVKPYGIATRVRVAFGQDYEIQDYTWEEIAQMINER